MTDTNSNSKTKEKRLEEKEKLEAELERSYAVAKMKEAHKQIEDIERLRKRSAAQSICTRISILFSNIVTLTNTLNNPKYRNVRNYMKLPLPEGIILAIQQFEQTYTSITYDFQRSLDMNQETFAKMFPIAEVRKDTVLHARLDLANLRNQLNQMAAYCQRILS